MVSYPKRPTILKLVITRITIEPVKLSNFQHEFIHSCTLTFLASSIGATEVAGFVAKKETV